jgi:hypothetical protein
LSEKIKIVKIKMCLVEEIETNININMFLEQFWSEFLQNRRYKEDMSSETIFIFLFLNYYCKKLSILKLSNQDI